jgi:hypothetical protein
VRTSPDPVGNAVIRLAAWYQRRPAQLAGGLGAGLMAQRRLPAVTAVEWPYRSKAESVASRSSRRFPPRAPAPEVAQRPFPALAPHLPGDMRDKARGGRRR